METEILVATRALGPGLAALEGALRDARLPQETVLELLLAAEEVLTNVADYAHDDGSEHWVRVGLVVAREDVTLVFEDDGRPFDPTAAPAPDLAAPMAERPIGGLGIHLIRSLVDTAEYARAGSQNVLTLRKRVGQGPGGVA